MLRGAEWTASHSNLPVPALHNVTLRWLVRTALCLSFLLALLEYAFHSAFGAFFHLFFFFLAGLLVLCGRRRTERLQNLFGSGSFAILIAAMLFSEAISYTTHDTYSLLYGLVFMIVIVAARLIVQEIGVPEVIRAFSQAGMLTVVFFCTFDFRSLMAGTSARFSGSTDVHPNLVAFILGGFLPVLIWRGMEYKEPRWRRAAFCLAAVDFGIVFLTGSRGALSAILFSGLVVLLRSVMTGRSLLSRMRLSRGLVIFSLFLMPALLVFLVQHNRIGQFGDYLNTTLALTSGQRGIKSGFSGRTNFWHIAFILLRQENRWLFGFGYRAGDRFVGTIDNGYVQLLFESGLIGGAIILGAMLRTFLLLWRATKRAGNDAWTRYYTVLWSLMIIYFLNNVSTRYLFSFGSSFSLCVILMMTASRRELVGVRATSRPELPAARRPQIERDLAWKPPGQESYS